MNLDDSAKVAREIEERNRKKRLVITSILLCMVLMAGLGILIFFIVLKDNNTLKIYVNNVQRAIPATLFVEDNGVKAGKTYWYRIRAYRVVGTKKVYSGYTKPIKVVVK